jgi:hypothetical protein
MPRPDDRSPPIAILMNDWIGWWERPFFPALLADSEAPAAKRGVEGAGLEVGHVPLERFHAGCPYPQCRK